MGLFVTVCLHTITYAPWKHIFQQGHSLQVCKTQATFLNFYLRFTLLQAQPFHNFLQFFFFSFNFRSEMLQGLPLTPTETDFNLLFLMYKIS